jgi:hypothetical protein
MGGEALTGIGLSVVFGFARWRFPTVPPKIADAGLFSGICLLLIGIIMPEIHLSPLAIVFFVVGCLSFGAAAHFATKDRGASVSASKNEATNTMGSIINNSGINTQGQQGDNVVGKK